MSTSISLHRHATPRSRGAARRLLLTSRSVWAAQATGFHDTAIARLAALGYLPHDGQADEPTGIDSDALDRSRGCVAAYEAREVLTFTLAALSSHAHYDALTHELEIRPYGWIDIDGSHNFDDWLTLPRGEATRPGPAAQVVMFGTTGPYNRGGAVLGLRLADALTERDPGDHGAYVLGLGPIDEHWDRWTAPDIGATELVDTFDLDPLPSPVQLAEEAGLRGLDVDPDCR